MTSNGNGRRIPWKMIFVVLGIGGSTVGGYSVWDAIEQVEARAEKAHKLHQDTVITPLSSKVEKHADSISALDKAVGVVSTKVTAIEKDIDEMKDDLDDLGDRFDRQEDMQSEILRLLQQQINGDSAGRP